MLTVWAVDPNRVRRGHLLPDGTCQAVLRDAGVGTWAVTVRHDTLAAQVRDGWRIVLQEGSSSLISGPVEGVDPDLAEGSITFNGTSDLVHGADRLTYPNPAAPAEQQTAAAYYVRTGPAETIIRNLFHENVGTGALVARRAAGFTVATSLGRGATVKTNLRFKNVLEEARKLARLGGVTFDAIQETNGSIVLRFRVPVDRRRSVRFTDRNGGITGGGYTLSAPTATVVVVAGQGEGTARTVLERSRATTWGRRVEVFKDQRDTDDAVQLEQSATEQLDEGAAAASAAIDVQETEGRTFGVDFWLGDTVTAQFGSFEISEPVRAVELAWDGHGRTAKLTLGDHEQEDDNTPDWVKYVKNLDARVRGMETR